MKTLTVLIALLICSASNAQFFERNKSFELPKENILFSQEGQLLQLPPKLESPPPIVRATRLSRSLSEDEKKSLRASLLVDHPMVNRPKHIPYIPNMKGDPDIRLSLTIKDPLEDHFPDKIPVKK
ncbi:MAG: hypothetical protein JXQ90_18685 [Cyclobacteriaceae bacterium]